MSGFVRATKPVVAKPMVVIGEPKVSEPRACGCDDGCCT